MKDVSSIEPQLAELQRVIKIIMANEKMDKIDDFARTIDFAKNTIYDIMSNRRKKNNDVISAITRKYPSYALTDFKVDTFQESSSKYSSKYTMLKDQLVSRLRTLITEMEENKGDTNLDIILMHEIKSIAKLYEKEIARKYTIYNKEN